MPVVIKLESEEVAFLKLRQFGPKARIREEYDALLEGIEIGDFGELRLSDAEQEESHRIRTLLQYAATRRGMRLSFKGMVENTGRLVFEVVRRTTGSGLDSYRAEVESPKEVPREPERVTVPTTEKRKAGRPPKFISNVPKK